MAARRIIALALALALCCIAADDVSVQKTKAKVETKYFDPANPPEKMPKLSKDEAAVTEYDFGCSTAVEGIVSEKGEAKSYNRPERKCRNGRVTSKLGTSR